MRAGGDGARRRPAAAEALRRLRQGRVRRQPGYDGEYGRITLFAPHELELLAGQTALFGLGEGALQRRRTAPVAAQKAAPAAEPAQAAPVAPVAPAAPVAGLNERQAEAVLAQRRQPWRSSRGRARARRARWSRASRT